jgi:hypothetical protein
MHARAARLRTRFTVLVLVALGDHARATLRTPAGLCHVLHPSELSEVLSRLREAFARAVAAHHLLMVDAGSGVMAAAVALPQPQPPAGGAGKGAAPVAGGSGVDPLAAAEVRRRRAGEGDSRSGRCSGSRSSRGTAVSPPSPFLPCPHVSRIMYHVSCITALPLPTVSSCITYHVSPPSPSYRVVREVVQTGLPVRFRPLRSPLLLVPPSRPPQVMLGLRLAPLHRLARAMLDAATAVPVPGTATCVQLQMALATGPLVAVAAPRATATASGGGGFPPGAQLYGRLLLELADAARLAPPMSLLTPDAETRALVGCCAVAELRGPLAMPALLAASAGSPSQPPPNHPPGEPPLSSWWLVEVHPLGEPWLAGEGLDPGEAGAMLAAAAAEAAAAEASAEPATEQVMRGPSVSVGIPGSQQHPALTSKAFTCVT